MEHSASMLAGALEHAGTCWRLRCFGDFALSDPHGRPVGLTSRKARALVAWLAFEPPHRAGRERLMALLWSDRGDEQARASLRQLLVGLKPLTTGEWPLIEPHRDAIGLVRNRLQTDLDTLKRAGESGDVAAFATALGRVHQELFCDLDHVDAAFDDWLRTERTRRIDELFQLAIPVADQGLEQGSVDAARAIALQLQRIDPAHEGAAQLGMRGDAAAGHMGALKRRYQRLSQHLRIELDEAPGQDTETLYQTLIQSRPAVSEGDSRHGAATASHPDLWLLWRRAVTVVSLFLTLSIGNSAPVPKVATLADRDRITLVVLPFADLSPGRNSRWFAEGVSEEILGLLSARSEIRVIGRSSAMMLGPAVGFEEARRRLGVSHLLEGSVRRQGNRVRVNVRLVRTSDGLQVWGQAFDRNLTDIFALQDEIGSVVVTRLLGTREDNVLLARRTTNEVFDLYLTANSLAWERTERSLLEAQRLLRRAVTLDPDYAPAYARLAINIFLIDSSRTSGPFQHNRREEEQASQFARRALELDPGLADAYAALALAATRADQKLVLAQQAIQLDPGNYQGWGQAGVAHYTLCNPRISLAYLRRGAEIEPLNRASYENWSATLAEMGDFGAADAVISRFVAVSSEAVVAHHVLRAYAALVRGDLSRTIIEAQAAHRRDPSEPRARLYMGHALQSLGEREAATRILADRDRAIVGNYWGGRHREAIDRSTALMREPRWRMHALANALYRAGATRRLLTEYDGNRAGRTPDCKLWRIAPAVILAMRREGRSREAANLLTRTEVGFRQWLSGGFRAPGNLAVAAELRMLRGDREGALSRLEQAVAAGWLQQWDPFVRLDDPVFDDLRGQLRFRRVERRMAAEIARERRELAAERAGSGS